MWVSNTLLPFERISPGCIIRNITHPEHEVHNLSIDRYQKDGSFVNVHTESFSSAPANLNQLIPKMISSNLYPAAQSYKVISDSTAIYKLQQPEEWFHAASQSIETREWLCESIRRGQDAFLVVGLKTITNTKIKNQKTKNTESWSRLAARLRSCIWKRKGDTKYAISNYPGERIYAMKYRRLRFSQVASLGLEAPRQEGGTRLEVYMGIRGEDYTQVYDVKIHDDVGMKDLGGVYERVVSEADAMFYIP